MAQRMNVCVPPPLAPVTPMRFGSTSGRLEQEIEGADAVPGLQAHEALQPQFRLGVGEAFAMRDRLAVGVADHVVVEDDAAHAGELGAASLQRIACAPRSSSRPPLRSGSSRGLVAGLVESAVGPVAVRTQHAGQLARLALGPVEVAADVMARHAGEEDLFDGVAVAVDLAVDDGIQRRLLGHRPESVGDEHLLAQFLTAFLPML